MFEALRAEHMVYSLYIKNDGDNFRDALKACKTPGGVAVLLGMVFPLKEGEQSKLHKKIIESVVGVFNGKVHMERIRTDVNSSNCIEVIQALLCRLVNNSQPVLRSALADILLKMAVESPVVKSDLNWEDAKGLVFKLHNPCTRYRIVGVQWPPEPGRSGQLEDIVDTEDRLASTQIMEAGFVKNHDKRLVISFYQVNGKRIMSCGKTVRWDPRVIDTFDDELLYATSIVN